MSANSTQSKSHMDSIVRQEEEALERGRARNVSPMRSESSQEAFYSSCPT
jgi:hypothetical protein